MNELEREMDLALAECEAENRLLRARNCRLEAELETAKREWVGLTDEDEIDWDEVGLRSLVKAVETKLKEKNT